MDKHLKTIEDVREDMGLEFQKYSKTDEYKNFSNQLKNDNPTLSDYLIHLSIYGYFRDEYVKKLPKRWKKEFINVNKVDGSENTVLTKGEGKEIKSINVYSEEEHKLAFDLKPAKYISPQGDEIIPFEQGEHIEEEHNEEENQI